MSILPDEQVGECTTTSIMVKVVDKIYETLFSLIAWIILIMAPSNSESLNRAPSRGAREVG